MLCYQELILRLLRHYSRELITVEEFESCDDNSHSATDSAVGGAAVSDLILSLVVYATFHLLLYV